MLDYEKKIKEQIKKNLKIVQKNYCNNDFQKKIKKYSNKFDIPIGIINDKLAEKDSITLSVFAKDPTKQNFYEKTAAKHIQVINGVTNFENLPNNGPKALYLQDDKIRTESDFIGEKPTKSIDFKWEFKNIQYYAFHKYIKEPGGAQDNQFNEICNTIKIGRVVNSKATHKIIFICDGAYFNDEKIKILNSTAKINDNHLIFNIDQLMNYLNNIKE